MTKILPCFIKHTSLLCVVSRTHDKDFAVFHKTHGKYFFRKTKKLILKTAKKIF